MELAGRYRFDRDRETVLAALSDPEVLAVSVPYLEGLQVLGPGRFAGALALKFGFFALRLDGFAEIEEIEPPVIFEVRIGRRRTGGQRAGVRLREDEQGRTTVTYRAKVTTLGPFAPFGRAWVERTADREAQRFFQSVARRLGCRVETRPLD